MSSVQEPLNTEQLFSRTKQKRHLLLKRQLAVAAVFIAVGSLWFFKLLQPIESMTLDFWLSRPQASSAANSVILTISEKSIAQIGRWPWPSFQYAVIFELLERFGARSIYLEGAFLDSETAEEQAPLITVLEKKKIPVFFSADYVARYENAGPGLGLLALDQGGESGWARPVAEIAKRAFLSHRKINSDQDRVYRSWTPWLDRQGTAYPLAALKMRLENFSGFDKDALIQTQETDLQFIPWNKNNFSNWPRIDFADLMQSYLAMREGMRPTIPPELFQGKDVFIGLTHESFSPSGLTPWRQAAFPVEIMAAIYEGLKDFRRGIHAPVSRGAEIIFWLVLAAGLIVWTGIRFDTVYWIGFTGFVAALFLIWSGFALAGLWFSFAAPLLFLLFSALGVYVFDALHAKQERSALFHLATRDGLTNLYVIRHFRVIMNQMTREATMRKESLAVILMDIDHFKKINDTHGHPAGDMVLKKTAEIIQAAVRQKRTLKDVDFVARYGGEEFIILIRRNSLESTAERIAERIRLSIQNAHYDWNGTKISVTTSLGVAILNEGENIPDPMVHRADKALYLAKQSGRNQVRTQDELSH